MHGPDGKEITCSKPAEVHFIDCPNCGRRKALHCTNCLTPVTGCLCTLKQKADEEDRLQGGIHN